MVINRTNNLKEISSWYKSRQGKALLESEINGLSKLLPRMFGYYIAQIGGPSKNTTLISSSNINNKIFINPEDKASGKTNAITCNLEELPFVPNSIDVFVLFHILEFVKDPEKILSEVYDSLINGGSLVVVGFNPHSLWGLARFFKNDEKRIWAGHWISYMKLTHLLLKVGFKLDSYQTFYFRPPSKNPKKMLFLEGIGQIFCPDFGASYILVAKKAPILISPIKELRSVTKTHNLNEQLAKQTTRTFLNMPLETITTILNSKK